jgi:hypothetical protein
MKFAKYSDTSGVAPASCRHRRMPPGRRRYDEGLSPYFANISNFEKGQMIARGIFLNDVGRQAGTFCAKRVDFTTVENESFPTQGCEP